MISLGAHPKLVMERLGHSDISITMDVYGHVFESMHEHVTQQLDALYLEAIAAPLGTPDGSVSQLFA